jgi:hypothetical protein
MMDKTITLPADMMQFVINAIAQQPYFQAAPVLERIRPQLEKAPPNE